MFHPRLTTLLRYFERDLPVSKVKWFADHFVGFLGSEDVSASVRSESKARRISDHLSHCPRCKEVVDVCGDMVQAVAPARDLSYDIRERFMQNLVDVKRIKQPIVAGVKAIVGNVMIFRDDDDQGVEAFAGIGLKKGDTLKLIDDSLALIELNDGSNIWLNKETEIDFSTATTHNLFLRAGELFAMMKPQKGTFKIQTPSAILGVIGTDFDAKVKGDETILEVLKGKVSFENDSGATVVRKRYEVRATQDKQPVPTRLQSTALIGNWRNAVNVTTSEAGSSLTKLIIGIVGVMLLIVGYLIYHECFVHGRSHGAEFSESIPTQPPAPDEGYSKWAGDWVSVERPQSNPAYHLELNQAGMPDLTISDFAPVMDVGLPKENDDSSLVYELRDSEAGLRAGVRLRYEWETDTMGMQMINPDTGEIISNTKVTLVRLEDLYKSSVYAEVAVDRANADIQAMATALEAFYLDNGVYPEWVLGDHVESFNKAPEMREMPSFKSGALTTPLAYLTYYLPDPFVRNPEFRETTFSYYSDERGWILISPGPDGDYDVNPRKDYTSTIPQPSTELLLKSYDPTNGAISDGDIFRVKH